MFLVMSGRASQGTRSNNELISYSFCMRKREFEKLVEEGFERLPEWVRGKIQNVALLIADEPSEADRRDQGLEEDETLLGLYKGIPLSERGSHYGEGMVMPDTITLYKRPLL